MIEQVKNFINGQWIVAETSQYEDVPNPATGKIIAKVPMSTLTDLEQAVAVAKETFKSWSKVAVPSRARILFRYQQLLVEHWEELAKIITIENGKSIKNHTEKCNVELNVWSLQLVHLH